MGAPLDLVAIGSVSPSVMDGVAARLSKQGFDTAVRAGGEAVQLLAGPRTKTLQAQTALSALRREPGKQTFGVTEIELNDPGHPFVYGMGELNGRASVFSLSQFRRGGLDEETLLDRFCAAALHELAHNVGMEHCRNKGCLMHSTHEPAAYRQLDMKFCASCSAMWRRRIRAGPTAPSASARGSR